MQLIPYLHPPLRIDIGFPRLLRTIFKKESELLPQFNFGTAIALTGFCVRGMWDSFLQVVSPPKGSEIIVSGINIPHMEAIIRAHGCIPITADLDEATLLPTLATLQAARTPKTVGVLISHLFGTWSSLSEIGLWCKEHEIFLVEDCAQAFMGHDFTGSAQATTSLFSFGTIKRCTAFGGAVAIFRDMTIAESVKKLESHYQSQEKSSYKKKICKYFGLKLISAPYIYALVVKLLHLFYPTHEEMIRNSVRGFPKGTIPFVFRKRPCQALRKLVHARWFETDLDFWKARSDQMWSALQQAGIPRHAIAGYGAEIHSFWLLPLKSTDPETTIRVAKKIGLDATRGVTSLVTIGEPHSQISANFLSSLVYLPVDQRRIFTLGKELAKTL